MIDDNIEQDALRCWDIYRQMSRQEGRNAEFIPSMEVWVLAFASGAALGRIMEREACSALADGCGQASLAEMIRARESEDDAEDADD